MGDPKYPPWLAIMDNIGYKCIIHVPVKINFSESKVAGNDSYMKHGHLLIRNVGLDTILNDNQKILPTHFEGGVTQPLLLIIAYIDH